jgi:hypothetical protein
LLRARLPGYSKDLPPRRNIWGEVIVLSGGLGPDLASPLYSKRVVPDPATDEVVNTGSRLSFPERKIGVLELKPFEYDRLLELTGKVAHRTILNLVTTPNYEKLPKQLRREAIEGLYSDARSAAREIVMAEIIKKDPLRLPKTIESETRERFGLDSLEVTP